MVATVQVLRSSAVAVTYYERDGYYARNDPEHRQASFWHGMRRRRWGSRPMCVLAITQKRAYSLL